MSTTRIERVGAADGDSFDAHVTIPDTGSGPGLVLCQEIFGVGDYIVGSAARLAALGFVVMAPDLFWRIEPNVALPHDEEGLGKALELSQRLDFDKAVQDTGATLHHLRGLTEVTGPSGVFGFCLGGSLAFFAAARFVPDFAVSYYGSAVPDAAGMADDITCPILFHFGGADPYITREAVEIARRALEPRDNVEFHVHEGAGHAFDNYRAPMFHNPEAAEAAWRLTTDFLTRRILATA